MNLKLLKNTKDVVIDTMIFIYLFEDHPVYGKKVESIFQSMENGYFSGLVTPITASEIIVKPLKSGRNDIAAKYQSALTSIPNLRQADLAMDTGFMAGGLRAKYGLPLPDMIQVATALHYSTHQLIITNDKALSKVEEVTPLFL